ncbi:MAG: RDD family protein [Verrucomicrobiota bacterium]
MPAASEKPASRPVTAETLTASPAVLGQPLAEPWRRLAGIAIDLGLITALSILSRPWLGLATGAMLLVLFGNSASVPLPLKLVRTACRALGLTLAVLSAIALGHVSAFRSSTFNLEALTGDRKESAAMRESVHLSPNPSTGELQQAADRLQRQVSDLKKENREWQESSGSWHLQIRAFLTALGVTFGWSGVYFTLFAGGLGGRTPGKFFLGTRALKINGHPFTFFDAFVRHGGYIAGVAMGMTGFLNLLWDPNRRAVEDRIAGTVVVKT